MTPTAGGSGADAPAPCADATGHGAGAGGHGAGIDARGAAIAMSLLETTSDFAVLTTSLDGTIDGWFGAAERLLGHTAAEAIGQPLSMIFTPQDRALGLDRHELAVARTTGRSEDDRWHVRRDGLRFWASGVLMAVRGPGGAVAGLCKVLRDKSDTAARLSWLQNQVEVRDAELAAGDRFLRSTVHELRNPLMPIVSALGLLQRPDAAHLHDKAVKVLESQVAVLTRLIDDLNRDRRAEESPPLAREPLSLNLALRTTVDGLSETATASGQHLTLLLPPADIRLLADPARLQQMLSNLLGNAVKYTPAGGRITVSASVETDMAVVRVEDTGIGIPPEMLPTIFELFARCDNGDSAIPGAGVGLAVVKQLAALHGGWVDVRSPGPGKGSAFGLRLPVLRDAADDGGEARRGPPGPSDAAPTA